jgi:hypothetical protein
MSRKRGGSLVSPRTIAETAITNNPRIVCLRNDLFLVKFLKLEERGNRWLKAWSLILADVLGADIAN